MTEPLRLVCPYCGDEFTAELTYTARYSEHRDLTGYECDNYQCDALWGPRGEALRLPRSSTDPVPLPDGSDTTPPSGKWPSTTGTSDDR